MTVLVVTMYSYKILVGAGGGEAGGGGVDCSYHARTWKADCTHAVSSAILRYWCILIAKLSWVFRLKTYFSRWVGGGGGGIELQCFTNKIELERHCLHLLFVVVLFISWGGEGVVIGLRVCFYNASLIKSNLKGIAYICFSSYQCREGRIGEVGCITGLGLFFDDGN